MLTRLLLALLGMVVVTHWQVFAQNTAPASQWDSAHQNALYNLPKGWSAKPKGPTLQLIPPDLAAGEQAAIILLPSMPMKGDFKTNFNNARQALRGKAKFGESETQLANADEGYPVLYTQERLEGDGFTQFRYFLASQPGDRFEMVLLSADGEKVFQRYTPAFDAFVKTLAYRNAHPELKKDAFSATQPSK